MSLAKRHKCRRGNPVVQTGIWECETVRVLEVDDKGGEKLSRKEVIGGKPFQDDGHCQSGLVLEVEGDVYGCKPGRRQTTSVWQPGCGYQ